MSARIKLLTFDITHTLLKFSSCTGQQYVKVAQMYGVDRDPSQIDKSFKSHWMAMNLKHPNYGRSTGLTSSDWWKEIIRLTFTSNNSSLTANQLDSISSHLFELYKSGVCWTSQLGAEKLLEDLRKKDVVLGVISNFDERLECVLQSTDMYSYFDFILASSVVGIAKPRKEIFELALRRAHNVKSQESLHIGDNVELDYLASKKAGWNSILLSDEKKKSKPPPENVELSDIAYNTEDIRTILSSNYDLQL